MPVLRLIVMPLAAELARSRRRSKRLFFAMAQHLVYRVAAA
jgi:hypothetical protein